MAVFNIHEAKTQFSRLVDEAAAGREVVIAKAGKPVAKLVSICPDAAGKRMPRQLGMLAGEMTVHADFDDPLPEDILAAFERPLKPSVHRRGEP